MENPDWRRLAEHALLEKRIQDLKLAIKGSALEPLIEKLYEELRAKGLVFNPPCFLADEWFCPVGVPAIGVPFYLAHTRLRRLEKKIILEVEGGTKKDFMKLIRHETGHAYSYAYNLYKKKQWRELFGSAAEEYRDTYRPRPYSRAFVTHLDNWYAQSHPDEDFAETFAVWLTPGLDWRKKFRGWKALEKLEYVDALMKSLAGKPAVVTPSGDLKQFAGLSIRLKTYFKRKKKFFEEDYPDFHDNNLKTVFTAVADERGSRKASRYLRDNHERILAPVARWTREKKYTVDKLMRNLIHRCDALNLYARKDDHQTDFEIAAYITTLISNHLFTGKFKRSK